MHKFIRTGNDDVMAVTVSDSITGKDLSAMLDRLEACMARHQPIHVFVETRTLDGIDVSQLGLHMARAMPLFARLRHFARVAVVSDQAWVRALARVESAMLPSVSYRTFEPDQRDEALAWVAGSAGG